MLRSILAVFTIVSVQAQAQIIGKWTTLDDTSGEPRSVIELTERSGKLFGKVAMIHSKPGEDPDPVCGKCASDDPRFQKKVIGMEILQELAKDGSAFAGGSILDPENGKVYRCKIWMEDNVLKVRGYWGPFYRTQSWVRLATRP